MARPPAPIANRSPPISGAKPKLLPVTASLMPVDIDRDRNGRPANSRVLMSTEAPEKSPGWSGVKGLDVVIAESSEDGKGSGGTTSRSGSADRIRPPLGDAWGLRSPLPRAQT